MAFIEIRNKKLHLLTLNSEQKKSPIALFLHGLFIGSSAGWYFHIAGTLKKYCHIALLDFPGHGLSEKTTTGYDSDELVEDIKALTPYLLSYFEHAQAQIYLIGHSYGAWVSLKAALQVPRLPIKALCLIELPLPPTLAQLPLDLKDPTALLTALPAELLLRLQQGKRQAQKLYESLSFLLLESSLLQDLSMEEDISDDALTSLALPVLLVYADQSPCQKSVNRLLKYLPNVTTHLISGGHFVLNEQPKQIAELLNAFIQEQEHS